MSDFQQQEQNDESPWAKHNENFDSIEGASMYAERQVGHSGLNFGYMGGVFKDAAKTASTVALTNSATNYIVAHLTTGVVSASTSTTNWNATTTYARLHKVVTAGGQITAVTDYRFDEFGLFPAMGGGGGTSTSGTPLVTISGNGASHQIDSGNAESMHRFTGTGAKTFLVEPDSNLAAGQSYHIANRGASGNVTIVVDSNMVVNNPKAGSRVLEPGDTVTLYFVSATEADLFGSTQ